MRNFLRDRMDSLIAQTVKDWELILCDSYSNDGSWELLQEYRGDPRIRLCQVARAGVFAGWNECLRRARGTYIYIATSDDTSDPHFLEKLLEPLESGSQAEMSFCDFQTIDEVGRPVDHGIAKFKRQYFGNLLNRPALWDGQAQFLLHLAFGTVWTTMAAVLFRRRLLDTVGLFRTDMGRMADFEWSLKASLASSSVFVPGKLVTWRIHDRQCTGLRPLHPSETSAVLNSVRHMALHHPAIPAAWRDRPEWPELLLHRPLCDYFDSFRLYRGQLKRAPLEFLANVVRCAVAEPKFLSAQISRGFKWSGDLSPVPNDIADRLLTAFHPAWPPAPLQAG